MLSLTRFLPVNSGSLSESVPLEQKYASLCEIVKAMESVVIGFSGGADSALLARIAKDEIGERAIAVVALSESYPKREMEDAQTLAREMGIALLTVEARELDNEDYASNPTDRCYYCKTELFTHLSRVARERGIKWIAYGANHDDFERLPPRPQSGAGIRRPRAPSRSGTDKARNPASFQSSWAADMGQTRDGLPFVPFPLRHTNHGGTLETS